MADIIEKPLTGLTAKVMIGPSGSAKTLAYISGVTLNMDKAIIEILAFGMSFKEKVPAIKDWNVSVDGTAAFTTGGTQEELYKAYEDATPLTLGIYLSDTIKFEGTGFVQSLNIDAAPDDKINITSEIAGSGATLLDLTVTPPTPGG